MRVLEKRALTRMATRNQVLPGPQILHAVPHEGARRLSGKPPRRDVLYHVVPDLRGVVRSLSLSGRVPKFTAE
jgi:hypothetical protein